MKIAPTYSKHNNRTATRNRTRLLKPAIGLKRPEVFDKSKYDKKIKCLINLGDTDSTTYKIPWPTLGTGLQNSGLFSRKGLPGASHEKIRLAEQ